MAYVLLCNLPNFQQMRPDFDKMGTPEDRWELVTSPTGTGGLTYRHQDTGEEIVCPGMWYNHPVSSRAKYFRFCADRADTMAKTLEDAIAHGTAKPWDSKTAKDHRASAANLRALADEMDRTGRFPE